MPLVPKSSRNIDRSVWADQAPKLPEALKAGIPAMVKAASK